MGKLIQHAVYATHKVFAHGLPIEIAHVVNTHTHQSALRSTSVEGGYLFYADYADADSYILPRGDGAISAVGRSIGEYSYGRSSCSRRYRNAGVYGFSDHLHDKGLSLGPTLSPVMQAPQTAAPPVGGPGSHFSAPIQSSAIFDSQSRRIESERARDHRVMRLRRWRRRG